ncbi:hypothetical protein BVY03_00915 [bacterium K02(2017)]|nr:hypothetical protein BVY03_00915 [bacterium K02(2017)]
MGNGVTISKQPNTVVSKTVASDVRNLKNSKHKDDKSQPIILPFKFELENINSESNREPLSKNLESNLKSQSSKIEQKDEFLPPLKFQPYVGFMTPLSWNRFAGLPNGLKLDSVQDNGWGTHTATVTGVTTARSQNMGISFGMEYRKWDKTSANLENKEKSYRQISPTLALQFQIDPVRIRHHNYKYYLNTNELNARATNAGFQIASDIALENYDQIDDRIQGAFTGLDPRHIVSSHRSAESVLANRYKMDLKVGAGQSFFSADRYLGFLESTELGVQGSLAKMDQTYLWGLGIFSDISFLRFGKKIRVDLVGQAWAMYYDNPFFKEEQKNMIYDDNHSLDLGLRMMLKTSFGSDND